MSALPAGWSQASLGHALSSAAIFTDGDWVETKDQDPTGEVRLTQLADVGVGEWRNRSARYMNLARAQQMGCTFLKPGDVLVARMPDPLGRACIFPGDPKPCVTAVDVCVIRPDPHVLSARWLMWALNAPAAQAQMVKLQSGTTRKRISRRNLGTITLVIPPRPEQERVVAAIEEQFSRLDEAEHLLSGARSRCLALESSVLAQAVEGDWPTKSLSEVLLLLRNGVFVSRPSPEPPGVPIYRISAVRPLHLDKSDIRYARISSEEAKHYLVQTGDLLFTRYSGNPSYVGSCAVVPEDAPEAVHPDKLIRGVVDRSLAEPQFVAIAANVGAGRRQIEDRLKTTAGQVGIAGGQLRTVEIPVPPLEDQRRIIERADQALTLVQALMTTIDHAIIRAARLRRSILERAFSGQLVPQDPSDEPASKLLARIRAERAEVNRPRRRQRS